MSCTPVKCAVNAIAEPIGQLPVYVYALLPNGASERVLSHPVSALLNDKVNDWTPASVFREQMARDCLLHGNAYAFINRVNGSPVELNRLDPASVQVEINLDTGEPIYRIVTTPNGAALSQSRVIPFSDIVHIKIESFDSYIGASPIRLAQDAIGLALILERHANKLFANGARPSGVLKFPGKLVDKETIARMRASWNSLHTGSSAGGTALLEEGGDFTALTFSSVDSQFLELRKFSIAEISRVFRVPPHLLGDLENITLKNGEELSRQFVQNTLVPWFVRFENEFRLKLFNDSVRAQYDIGFDSDALVRADLQARAQSYSQMIAARVMNPNEVRAIEGLPPYQGGDEFINPNISQTNTQAPNV